MSQSTICRLCVQACNDFERLYNDNGRANELHELALEYFHPKIVDMEAAKHLSAVCVECAPHIYDFHQFQASITMAQLKLLKEMDHRKVTIKTENLEEEFLEDFPNSVAVSDETITELGEDESISRNYKAFKVKEKEEFNKTPRPTKMIKLNECPKNSTIIPMVEIASTHMTDPIDFIVKPELEIIDVHQTSEHSSDDDADMPPPDCSAATKGSNTRMRRQHDNKVAKTTNNSGNVSTESVFVCEVFKCKLCDYAWEFKGSLRRHMKQRHENTGPEFEFDYEESTQVFKCKVCQAAFNVEKSLRKHMEQNHWDQYYVSQKFEFDYDDTNKVFLCTLCGRTHQNRQFLINHMARHHWVTPSIQRQHIVCQICDDTFETKLALAQHYYQTHCPPGLYPCSDCGQIFRKLYQFQLHRRQIHSSQPKPHKCDDCGKTFRIPSELRRHLLSHTTNKMYSCTYCPIKFKYSSNLLKHTKRLHGVVQQDAVAESKFM